jgi:hypothetical protein
LFVWSFLLGVIGTLTYLPVTLLLLAILENFKATQFLTRLMRFTGEEKIEESKVMIENLKGGWGKKSRGTIIFRDHHLQEKQPC